MVTSCRWYATTVIICTLALAVLGCTPQAGVVPSTGTEDASMTLMVSIVPQQYFVERIAGGRALVGVMVPPGASPATYEPKPEQLRQLSKADAYFRIRVPFEDAWMDRIASASNNMLVVDTTQGIERVPLAHAHEHDEKVDHNPRETSNEEEEGLDPHVWLSPDLVKVQARNIYDAIVVLDPEHAPEYEANLQAFERDIDALVVEIGEILRGHEGAKFLVFHPSWGYFARDFGLEMIAIEVGGQEPSAAELAAIITEAKDEGIRVVFAQPEFSTTAAETIANEIEGEVVLISPLAREWMDNMRRVADAFARAL